MAVSLIEARGCKPTTYTKPLSTDFTSGMFSYTAPSDGILYLCVMMKTRTYWGIQWNGQPIGDFAQYPSSPSAVVGTTVPIYCKKGDVITAGQFTANGYIVASKTAFISFG